MFTSYRRERMVMSQLMFIITGLCALLSGNTSEVVRCYSCSSAQDPTCVDPFSSADRAPYTCQQGAVCAKVIAGSQVTRGCMPRDQRRHDAMQSNEDAKNCYTDIVSPSFQTRTVCSCDEDLCNFAVAVDVNIKVVVATLIAPLLVWT